MIVMGPGLDTWARLSFTHKFSMIVSLRDCGREEEKSGESSALNSLRYAAMAANLDTNAPPQQSAWTRALLQNPTDTPSWHISDAVIKIASNSSMSLFSHASHSSLRYEEKN